MNVPKTSRVIKNLCALFLFSWKIVICIAAPVVKRNRKTAVMGTSGMMEGVPPRAASDGGYGGPVGA